MFGQMKVGSAVRIIRTDEYATIAEIGDGRRMKLKRTVDSEPDDRWYEERELEIVRFGNVEG
jgi:hypothetical protein